MDCWGLLVLVYLNEFGISLPDMPGISVGSALEIHSAIAQQAAKEWTEVDSPFDGCAVAMSQLHAMHHVGIWADADGGRIVHSWEKQNVVADSLKSIKLKGIRTLKFYRHLEWQL